MKRTPLIAGNWKMFAGGATGLELARGVVEACGDLAGVDVVVAPPFTALAAVASELAGTRVDLGAQNMHHEDEGAFTGVVSPSMLLESGCSWVILGHSERRQHFHETDQSVSMKVRAALAHKLRPIVCVGETLAEREADKTLQIVSRQIDAVLPLLAEQPGFGAIAYEPVWAIGTGKVAGPEQAQEVHEAIRAQLAGKSDALAEQTRILYGGSVKPGNAKGLLGEKDVDGALVGGASLSVDDFAKIVEASPSRV